MQGTLDTFSVVEVLQMLSKARRSGTLHLECPERLVDVHFVHGRIAEARDSTRVFTDTVLGSQLLKRSLVNEAQLSEALAEQEHQPKPLGTILVDKGFLQERELREVLSRQVANTLVAAKAAGNGTFMFVADPNPKPVDCITIDTHAVLLEISSVGGDYCLAFEVLGQANTVLMRNHDYETLPRHSLTMGRDEFCVLSHVDDRKTVTDIARSVMLEEITVISILGKLCEAGVLLARAEKQTRAEDDAELRAHRDSVWAEVSQIFDDLGFDEPEEPAMEAPATLKAEVTPEDVADSGAAGLRGEAGQGDDGGRAEDVGAREAAGLLSEQLDWADRSR
ncbi:MAG TPA: DUF4388 domain-containing protein [Thermoleophilia bacterium]|nr:DUF4388 domain-containing protein [Thermoleophilia bacterium]